MCSLKNYTTGKNKNTISLRNRVFSDKKKVLCGDAGAGGAHVSARTAVFAFRGIDHVKTVAFGNSVLWAFGFTRAAGYALSGDFVSHGYIPFVFGLTLHRIAQALTSVNSIVLPVLCD
jgi:hypothetical protein